MLVLIIINYSEMLKLKKYIDLTIFYTILLFAFWRLLSVMELSKNQELNDVVSIQDTIKIATYDELEFKEVQIPSYLPEEVKIQIRTYKEKPKSIPDHILAFLISADEHIEINERKEKAWMAKMEEISKHRNEVRAIQFDPNRSIFNKILSIIANENAIYFFAFLAFMG